MRTRTVVLVTAVVLLASAAAVVTLAGFGDSGPVVVIDHGPGGGTSCNCPMNWAPVLCTAPDGSRQAFSNACFAGCNGYTECVRVVIQQ